MPKALLQYQDASEVLAAKSRKDLVEELSNRLTDFLVAEVKKRWKEKSAVVDGYVPSTAEAGSISYHKLLNSYVVLNQAQQIAHKKLGGACEAVLDRAAKNLILTKDHHLMSSLAKLAKSALQDYSDNELAVLISSSRLTDFKITLLLRNVMNMDSLPTYSWIMHQDRKNLAEIGSIPSFDEVFSNEATKHILSNTDYLKSEADVLHSH